MNHQIKEINEKIMQKCSFVSLQSIDQSGFCFDLRVDNIIFGPWGIENAYDRSITEGEMPMGELRDRGMTEDQEIQLMQEINDAMSICEDLTSSQKMIYYRLNAIGQAAVTKEVLEICSKKQTIYPDAFFEDAENARNDIYGSGGQAFEICWTLTDSRNPVVVDVQPEWFDEQILED